MARKRLYKVDSDNNLTHGKQTELADNAPVPAGYFDGSHLDPKKRWRLEDGNAVERPEDTKVIAQLKETARIYAGIEAQGQIAVAMKGDGAALAILTDEQFDGLNTVGEPVSSALLKGQFQTALKRWRSIYANPSTAPTEYAPLITAFIATPVFAQLDSEVVSVIKAKIKQHDNLTDEQIEQL